MSDLLPPILLSLAAGFLLGTAYFVSLWRSVRALSRSESRWRSFAAAGVLRLGGILGVIAAFLLLGADPIFILAGSVGFLAARLAATRLVFTSSVPERGED